MHKNLSKTLTITSAVSIALILGGCGSHIDQKAVNIAKPIASKAFANPNNIKWATYTGKFETAVIPKDQTFVTAIVNLKASDESIKDEVKSYYESGASNTAPQFEAAIKKYTNILNQINNTKNITLNNPLFTENYSNGNGFDGATLANLPSMNCESGSGSVSACKADIKQLITGLQKTIDTTIANNNKYNKDLYDKFMSSDNHVVSGNIQYVTSVYNDNDHFDKIAGTGLSINITYSNGKKITIGNVVSDNDARKIRTINQAANYMFQCSLDNNGYTPGNEALGTIKPFYKELTLSDYFINDVF